MLLTYKESAEKQFASIFGHMPNASRAPPTVYHEIQRTVERLSPAPEAPPGERPVAEFGTDQLLYMEVTDMNQKTEKRMLENRIEQKLDKIRSLRPRIADVGRIQDVEFGISALALEIGELLAAGEVSRKSGEWQRWVRQFLPIRPETAGKYIQIWMIRERVRIELSYDTAPEEEYEPDTTRLSAWLNQSADLFSDIDGHYRGTLRYPMKRLTRNQMLDFTLQRLLDWDHRWHGGDDNESANPSPPIVEDESVLSLARDDQVLADKVSPLIKRHMLTATDLCRGVRRLCRYAERLWHLAEEALVDEGRLQEISQSA